MKFGAYFEPGHLLNARSRLAQGKAGEGGLVRAAQRQHCANSRGQHAEECRLQDIWPASVHLTAGGHRYFKWLWAGPNSILNLSLLLSGKVTAGQE